MYNEGKWISVKIDLTCVFNVRVVLPMYRQVDKRNLQKQVIFEEKKPSSLLHTEELEITKQEYLSCSTEVLN